METEEKLRKNLAHKSFLIVLKYLPYIISAGYALTTLGDFMGLDLIGLGYVLHTSFTTWIFMLLASFIFKYCYIHRLPLYYIAVNDMLNIIDYYIGIPISVDSLLKLHLLVLFIFMSLYVYEYVKGIKKFIIADN